MIRFLLVLSCLVTFSNLSFSQEPLDAELRETISSVDVQVTDLFARTETKPLLITTFRPKGEGKFPLLVFNHGRNSDTMQSLPRQRFLSVVRFFVAQGFVVVVPTRVGYGDKTGFDPEYIGTCQGGYRLAHKEEAVYRQVIAARDFAKTLDFVDASKWVVAGLSVGGYTSVTVANRAPDGLVAAINFAGGFGGNPSTRKGSPCNSHTWSDALSKGKDVSRVPTLWVYWKNDWYWGSDIPVTWFSAFQKGGGVGKFVMLNDVKGDGHLGINVDFKNWTPVVIDFLKTTPLALKYVYQTPTPPKTDFANIDDPNKVPFITGRAVEDYKKFLLQDSPRVFAINPDGRWGWSYSNWDSIERALAFCNRGAKTPCRLYAVDEAVVWTP